MRALQGGMAARYTQPPIDAGPNSLCRYSHTGGWVGQGAVVADLRALEEVPARSSCQRCRRGWVDLLDRVLADVGDPHVARRRIAAEPHGLRKPLANN